MNNAVLNPKFSMDDLRVAAKRLYEYNLAVKPNETIVVITDGGTNSRIADALYEEGVKLYGDENVHKSSIAAAKERDDSAPIPEIPELDTADIFLAPTEKSVTHSDQIVKAVKKGLRGFSMPGTREYDFLLGAYVDKEITMKIAKRIEKKLDGLKEVTIISSKGTELTIVIDRVNNKSFIDDGDISKRGKVGNMPFGEFAVLPKYGKDDGTVVISFSSETVGKFALDIENGRVVSCDDNAKPFVDLLKKHNADILAELGFGINPAVECNPYNPFFNPLKTVVTEKCLYTFHLGFGTNAIFGGKNEAGIHKDGVIGSEREPPTLLSEGKEVRLWEDLNYAIFK